MPKQEVVICQDLKQDLIEAIEKIKYDNLFILTDETTHQLCLPLIKDINLPKKAHEIVIGAGDIHKTLDTLSSVWMKLSNNGASRHSLLINLGGGMVTDLGGFAASTFKRGISFINIPTTLLSMVDAAIGGKTGINFNGLKNEIGAFAPPTCVLLETEFLRTLDGPNFFSGYAEMLKHGIISNQEILKELLAFDLEQISYEQLKRMVAKSVSVKEHIVDIDPKEKGIRKALNFGHTFGHAFESLALYRKEPILHGYAVAWGLVCELYLSYIKLNFPKNEMRQIIQFIKDYYGSFYFTCKEYDQLYELMKHDKKNSSNIINFTLLSEVGNISLDQTATLSLIYETFDFYRECMGL